MADTADPPSVEQQLEDAETKILEIMFKGYPGLVSTLATPELAELRKRLGSAYSGTTNEYGEQLFEKAFGRLLDKKLISGQVGMGTYGGEISPEGIREVGRRRPFITSGELDFVRRIMLENIAKVAESIEANRIEQQTLSVKLEAVESSLIQVERDFYTRIFPFFAVFIGAFALIVTGAQGVVHITSTDPSQVLAISLAMMAPVTLLVLLLVVVAWGLTRLR